MEKYLKNPIILAIIVGSVIYVLMSYFYNPENPEDKSSKKSKKSKKKAKSGFFTDKRETTILVSAIAALGTWFLAKTYLVSEESTGLVDITGMDNPGEPVNPLVNSLLGPGAASNEAGIMNLQQPMPQPMNQPMNQPMAQPMTQPMSQPSVNPPAQPSVQPTAQPVGQSVQFNNEALQVQNAVSDLTNNLNRTNLTQLGQVQPGQGQTGGSRSYNLIGTGLDIPRSAIPRVLVDYN